MRKKFLLALFPVIMIIAGCAQTTIYPTGNNNFSSVSTSGDQGYAEKDALEKAEKHCADLGRRLVVLKHDTEYHGPDQQTKLVGGIAAGLLGAPNPTTSSSDYKVKLTFKCS